MPKRIKRVVSYAVLSIGCLAVALLFTESRTAFVAVFLLGLAIGLIAEILFWYQLYRVSTKRDQATRIS